jgi:hypothetical protein
MSIPPIVIDLCLSGPHVCSEPCATLMQAISVVEVKARRDMRLLTMVE